ncbi:MAG: hypothetical protein K6V73_06490 [Firmicutes bacterium]|nr:hypothetical protein [Bacillota bacterium]
MKRIGVVGAGVIGVGVAHSVAQAGYCVVCRRQIKKILSKVVLF